MDHLKEDVEIYCSCLYDKIIYMQKYLCIQLKKHEIVLKSDIIKEAKELQSKYQNDLNLFMIKLALCRISNSIKQIDSIKQFFNKFDQFKKDRY